MLPDGARLILPTDVCQSVIPKIREVGRCPQPKEAFLVLIHVMNMGKSCTYRAHFSANYTTSTAISCQSNVIVVWLIIQCGRRQLKYPNTIYWRPMLELHYLPKKKECVNPQVSCSDDERFPPFEVVQIVHHPRWNIEEDRWQKLKHQQMLRTRKYVHIQRL